MPRRKGIPKYRLHRARGLAVVTLDGRDYYLGTHGTPESRDEYHRLVAEYLANGCRMNPPEEEKAAFTVGQLMVRYWDHVVEYYPRHSKKKCEQDAIRAALRICRKLYERTPAGAFGPLALKACQQVFIERGLTRKTVNGYVWRIKRMFKWGVANELIPPSVFHGLSTVEGLRYGRSKAPEGRRVKPVPEEDVQAALPHVSAAVGAMIRLQWLTGMRPGEAIAMRVEDIDRSVSPWEYRPAHHKTEHHGHERLVPLGPKSQEILCPFLESRRSGHLFSPQESEEARNAKRRIARRSPMTPSQSKRTRKKSRKRAWQNAYTVDSYRRAIERACTKAGIEKWTPHRLRHSAATRLRKEFGLEAARMVLGHQSAAITEVYAEADFRAAAQIALRVG